MNAVQTPEPTSARRTGQLNTDQYITPNHFSVDDFDSHPELSVEEEFDLIAPVAVFLFADLEHKADAKRSLKRLEGLGHPCMQGVDAKMVLAGDHGNNFQGRYNALFMVICNNELPKSESFIDAWGAYALRHADGRRIFAGDACGFFPFYLSSTRLKERLALEE